MTPPTSGSDHRETVLLHALQQCRMFSDLPPDDLKEVAATCVLKSFEKGEYLFHEGDPAEGFYVVQHGSINIHRLTPDGKEQVIAVFRPFDAFAEVALTTVDTYPADAVALESSKVVLVRRRDFRDLILRRPELALRMLGSMSFHLKYLVQMIQDLKFKQIEARLAHYLSRQCTITPGSDTCVVELDMAKRVLASQLGVTSETLSRTLAKFREENLISVDGRMIHIIDRDGLIAYIEGARG